MEAEHKSIIIKAYENARCSNFAFNKAAFIASSLNHSRKSIVLDRVLTTDSQGVSTLVTDPIKIKQVTNDHFRTIAGAPPAHRTLLSDLTPFWLAHYSPQENIQSSIYSELLSPPTDDEWRITIASLPNNKAAGPSGISYEMLKHLSQLSSNYLTDLVSECFQTGCIPSQWKDATIYPIPKPTEWNCSLKNTRPICLLETARKLMTKS